jgi:Skp family chaperone for outer membrane proteins
LVKEDRPFARSADVRFSLIPAVIAATVTTLGIVASSAPAQGPNQAGANARKYHIAVVDVGYIFKNHQRFRTTMEGMKTEMEGIEANLKTKREAIAQKELHRQELNIGTPDYKQLDEELAREKANFNVEMTQLRKEFLEREAKVYHQTYLEVDDTVRYYAERNEIGLVLRFNGEPPDPNRREQVLQSINKPVVYQNKIDITPDILALLNRSERQATQPGQIPR